MSASKFKRNRLILAQSKSSERLIIATNQSALQIPFKYHYTFAGGYEDLLSLAKRISNETPEASDLVSRVASKMALIMGTGSSEAVHLYSACYDSNMYLNRHLSQDMPVDRYRAPRATDAGSMHGHDAGVLLAYLDLCCQQRQIDLRRN